MAACVRRHRAFTTPGASPVTHLSCAPVSLNPLPACRPPRAQSAVSWVAGKWWWWGASQTNTELHEDRRGAAWPAAPLAPHASARGLAASGRTTMNRRSPTCLHYQTRGAQEAQRSPPPPPAPPPHPTPHPPTHPPTHTPGRNRPLAPRQSNCQVAAGSLGRPPAADDLLTSLVKLRFACPGPTPDTDLRPLPLPPPPPSAQVAGSPPTPLAAGPLPRRRRLLPAVAGPGARQPPTQVAVGRGGREGRMCGWVGGWVGGGWVLERKEEEVVGGKEEEGGRRGREEERGRGA